MRNFVSMSLFAGLLIGIAGLVFLHVGGLGGAILFAFGLMAVTVSKSLLFTGKAGFLPLKESLQLIPMVALNAIGCLLMAAIAYSTVENSATAAATLDTIMAAREAASWNILITSVGTGIIVTLAVYGVRKGTYLPLLYGVPVFIMCGLPHCIADAYFYSCAPLDYWCANLGSILPFYGVIVVGNFVGCNFYRWVMGGNPE
jgi:formate/nitrite transporter FocA (FNT family)